MRIGQIAGRVGVSANVLRAWERRYGVLKPVRSEGGYRLYGPDDERRVRLMLGLIADGVSTQQAAGMVLTMAGPGREPATDVPPLEQIGLLRDALEGFDESVANTLLDGLLARYTARAVLSSVILRYLADLGARWEQGLATVAQEHFASGVIRGRLLGLARGWGAGSGPRAVLACPSGEQHDLGLITFGLGLREYGWRITYLGADTPAGSLQEAVTRLSPAATVLAVTVAKDLDPISGVRGMLAIGGGGATAKLARRLGAELLDCDPLTAADRVAARVAVATS